MQYFRNKCSSKRWYFPEPLLSDSLSILSSSQFILLFCVLYYYVVTTHWQIERYLAVKVCESVIAVNNVVIVCHQWKCELCLLVWRWYSTCCCHWLHSARQYWWCYLLIVIVTVLSPLPRDHSMARAQSRYIEQCCCVGRWLVHCWLTVKHHQTAIQWHTHRVDT